MGKIGRWFRGKAFSPKRPPWPFLWLSIAIHISLFIILNDLAKNLIQQTKITPISVKLMEWSASNGKGPHPARVSDNHGQVFELASAEKKPQRPKVSREEWETSPERKKQALEIKRRLKKTIEEEIKSDTQNKDISLDKTVVLFNSRGARAEKSSGPHAQPTPDRGRRSSKNPLTNDDSQHNLRKTGDSTAFLPPQYKHWEIPTYPPVARRKGYQGTVWLEAQVQPDGNVGKVKVKRSSGYSILDKAALKKVKEWVFIPALRGDLPVSSKVIIPVKFVLKNKDVF